MPANTLQTYTVIGIKESVDDKIYRVTPEETPFISMIGRRDVSSTNPEWLRESLRAPAANAAIEGADATYSAQPQPDRLGNRTQIFQDTASITGTTEAVDKYGRMKEKNRLVANKMIEVRRDMERQFIGSGAFVAGAAATPRESRGLYGWIATNNELFTGGIAPVIATNTAPTLGTLRPFTEALLKANVLKVYTSGGKATTLMVSPVHKQVSSGFTGNVTRFNDVSNKEVRLQTSFSVYGHDYGETKVIPNRVMVGTSGTDAGRVNTAYILDPEQLQVGVLRPFKTTELAKVGDADNYQVLTEATLICKEERALGAIRDLTLSGV